LRRVGLAVVLHEAIDQAEERDMPAGLLEHVGRLDREVRTERPT
jgi:hypothetical protein